MTKQVLNFSLRDKEELIAAVNQAVSCDALAQLSWGEIDESIVNYWPEEMVVRVHGGAKLGQINEVLKREGQFLPLDGGDDLTLSELVDLNLTGPLRSSFGGARDLLLGMALIDGQGRDIRVGGQTVKNVAGYDVTRLLVGAKGQLGVIYELTFKTAAISHKENAFVIQADAFDQIQRFCQQAYVSDAKPSWSYVIQEAGQLRLMVGYLGWEKSVEAQTKALVKLDDQVGLKILEQVTGDASQTLRYRFSECAYSQAYVVKLIVRLLDQVKLFEAISKLNQAGDFEVCALPEFGVCYLGWNDSENFEQIKVMVDKLSNGDLEVQCVVIKTSGGQEFPLGEVKNTGLAEQVKRVFDPKQIFMPRVLDSVGGEDG